MAGNGGNQDCAGGALGCERLRFKLEASAPSFVPDDTHGMDMEFPPIPLHHMVRMRRVRTLRAGGDATPAAAVAPPATNPVRVGTSLQLPLVLPHPRLLFKIGTLLLSPRLLPYP